MTLQSAAAPEPASRGSGFKLAVLDVDGTLLGPSGTVSPRVRAAIRAAHDAGCLVTLASGRRLWAVRLIVDALGLALPVILYNGAIVYDLDGERAVVDMLLTAEALTGALRLIWERGYQPVVYGHPHNGELVYTGPPDRDSPATSHYFDRPTVRPARLDLPSLYEVEAPPLLAAMGDELEMRALEGAVLAAGLDCRTLVERQSFVPRSPWWQLDISARDCTKGTALRHLCDRYGISIDETMAVGDGINDLDLVLTAGLGVAMGNAVPEVSAAAGARVADHAHDGAAEALERFLLGEPARAL